MTESVTGSKSMDSIDTSEENNDPKENFLRPGVKENESRSGANARKTASWEVISKKDVTAAQLEELDLQNSLNTPVNGSNMTQAQRQSSSQAASSSHGHGSSQSSEETGGKTGKLMSTFSTLKRMRKKLAPDQTNASKQQSMVGII